MLHLIFCTLAGSINYDNNKTICYLAGWVAEQLECHYKGNSNE